MTDYKVKKSEAEWKAQLDPMQFEVGTPLFKSDTQFDAGCGWPSYFEPVNSEVVERVVDKTHGMVRVEVRCNNCGSHLGHVFEDGPQPTGERFCINSAAIDFAPTK